MDRHNNQNFHAIAHGILKHMLEHKAAEAGIGVVFQEEAYTSRADFTKGALIPVHSMEKGNLNSPVQG